MDYVLSYTPPISGVDRIRILLIGPVGAGKSSFFNSINSIFRGHVTSKATAGCSGTSVTTEFRMYTVKAGRVGSTLPFILCDTMGSEELPGAGLDTDDISSIIKGYIPDKYKFNPVAPFQPDEKANRKPPTLSDKVHCVVYVLDACKVSLLPSKVEEKLAAIRKRVNSLENVGTVSCSVQLDGREIGISSLALQKQTLPILMKTDTPLREFPKLFSLPKWMKLVPWSKKTYRTFTRVPTLRLSVFHCLCPVNSRLGCRSLGISQIVLLTKVDEACPLVEEDLQDIYLSSYIKTKCQEVSCRVGVPVCNIIPVKNYSHVLDLDLNFDILLLMAVQQMLCIADDYFDDVTDDMDVL